jgi:hypothetical protein
VRALLRALALCALAAGAAHADQPTHARGSAPLGGGDNAAARTRALDDAVRQAVEQVVAASVDPQARAASADAIKKRVLRRARAYVRELKVAREGAEDGVYAVEIDALVNDGQLTGDLRALGVGVPPPVGTPVPDEPTGPAPRKRPPLALLVVTRQGDAVQATFGRAGSAGGVVAAALGRELAARGFKSVTAAGASVPVGAAGEGSATPLDVAQAAALTRAVGAGGALVASAELTESGRVRGTTQLGAECRIGARVDDVDSGRLAEVRAEGAGFGPDAAAAAAEAARAAAVRAGREVGRRLESHWPEESAAVTGRGAAVRVHGALRWSDVDAVSRTLAAVPGTERVTLARLARREVTLLVVGGAATRALVDAAAQASLPDLKVAARAQGGEVDVELAADATRPAPPPEAR